MSVYISICAPMGNDAHPPCRKGERQDGVPPSAVLSGRGRMSFDRRGREEEPQRTQRKSSASRENFGLGGVDEAADLFELRRELRGGVSVL